MSEEKLSYKDVQAYEKFFTLIPPFLLERFAKKNTNIVLKFKSKAENYLANLSDGQKNKLDLVLNSDIDELQSIMNEAYSHSKKKQYKILANPKYKQFLEDNIDTVREMYSG